MHYNVSSDVSKYRYTTCDSVRIAGTRCVVHDRTSDATAEAREKSVNEIPFTVIIRLIRLMFPGGVRVRTYGAESGFALGHDHHQVIRVDICIA